uniref:Apple domain-containing protein n=1 Tax=Tetradesmus obliquus TaxID=3088 RepID=A0A383VM06_TETOB|eukprot:jgi/Sobl393_1/14150/SZX65772.1
MSRILAAALLLAALPALLAQQAPRPQEPIPESAVSIAQDGIEFAFRPFNASNPKATTCETTCSSTYGWASLYAGTQNRTLCTMKVGSSIMVGTAQRVGSAYMCQYRASATARTPVSVRRGFSCGCAYACAAADYEYDWNYDNNNTPGGAPKPGNTNVDYEASKCRKTFWNQSPAPTAATGPKCTCATGCMCRARIGTTGKNYVTGWVANNGNSCITHMGAQRRYDLFFQCRPKA